MEVNSRQEDGERRKAVIIILLLLLLIIGLAFSISRVFGIGAPNLAPSTEEWSRSVLVSITKDARSFKKIAFYEYCIAEGEDASACDWQRTYTKNIEVSTTGEWYVRFRAVTEDGEIGEISAPTLVKVDNSGPAIGKVEKYEITEDGITVYVDASDFGSGISKYLYSLDGKNYEEDGDKHLFKGLPANSTQKIYIKLVDALGNETEFSATMDTIGQDGVLPVPDTSHTPGSQDTPVAPGSTDGGTTPTPEPTPSPEPTPEPEPVWDIPTISLDGLPLSFNYGEDYALPSSYDFGNDTGTVICTVDGKEYNNTKTITTSTHQVECTATSAHDKTVSVTKDITVNYTRGADEEMDGWIKLNLYYPEGSTDWEWRLGKEDTVRTGYDNDGWQPYTGPVLVKIDDISNVFIRYKQNNETYIVTPKGKITVDIAPNKWTLYENETTAVVITYDNTASTKEYRINKGQWQTYTEPLVVGPNTLIEARVSRTDNVYDSAGELQYTNVVTAVDSAYISLYATPDSTPPDPGGPVGPFIPVQPTPPSDPGDPTPPVYLPPTPPVAPTSLEGPVISANPTAVVDETTITITTKETAKKIYYRINNGSWKEYTAPFKVDKNCTIKAYYTREEDGKTSKTTTYYVDNIKVPSLPYVSIATSPDRYITDSADSVEVSITGSDYDTLEYSLDGNIYTAYSAPFTITESTTIYAKGTNANGETIESATIITKNPPVQKQNLDIYISTNPEKKDVEGLINKATVTINYDSRATKKYYKLNYLDSWKEYTGPFEITSNATIYAYATGENAYGETEAAVDFLTTGINSPNISFDSAELASEVKVSISYHKNANVKRYKIGNGEWQDYTEPFYVDENTTIYAYNSDILGNEATSSRAITSIVSEPNYTPLEFGTYYIIKLNYPNTADPANREYKWKKNGAWKQYDDKGILLIKAEYKDQYDLDGDGVVVKDQDGNDVVFTDHYYLLDVPASELSENLYMRWSNDKPAAPVIVVNDATNPRKDITVFISYADALLDKYYKFVSDDGEDTGWLEYTGPFTIEKNGTIYAKGKNYIEIESKLATGKIKNIDEVAPTITMTADLETPKQQVPVTVVATDNLGIDVIKYAKGGQNYEYFHDDGIAINNNSVVMITENEVYTFYVRDMVGHETKKKLKVTNVDTEAPDIIVVNKTSGFGTSVNIEIDFGDSTITQYSVGDESHYVNYTGEFTINAEDYFELANADGSLTIYAKGTDSAGNTVVVTENIYNLDLDMPEAPVVTSFLTYPSFTPSGFMVNNKVSVAYDNRDDITNYVDANDGTGYRIYNGPLDIVPGTVKAKSVKKSTGLTREISQEVNYPADSITPTLYDGDTETSMTIPANSKRQFTADMKGNMVKLNIISNAAAGAKVRVYDANNTLTSEVSISSATTNVKLPSNTARVEIVAGSAALTVSEVEIASVVESIVGDSILDIVENNDFAEEGYYIFRVADQEYPVHMYSYNGDQFAMKNTQFGNAGDVATANSYAENMVIVKVNGNFYVGEGVTVGPYYNNYGGPKGFMLYVTEKLINDGTIDNSHGAKAIGQNVYLWKNAITDDYEAISAAGAAGGASIKNLNSTANNGNAGTGRGTGGGASGFTGSSYNWGANGGTGTSYSGGPGGSSSGETLQNASKGQANGGAGGNNYYTNSYGGGAGNPGGCYNGSTNCGSNGTGGLMVIYADGYKNNGTIKASGSSGGVANSGGGGSGGGSINIFTNQSTSISQLGVATDILYNSMKGATNAAGGAAVGTSKKGGAGGAGTVNIGEIRNGQYYDLKTIIEQDKEAYQESITMESESIFSAVSGDLSEGNHFLKVNGESYPLHVYEFDGDQTFDSNMTFGDDNDIATATTEAQTMVIVKVKGNLTINEGVTVGPYYNDYGGPKGFMLYVTGKLTNNGTIDNSHGAKATGQDVYLWKNTDDTYVTIPAQGAAGGAGFESRGGVCSCYNTVGRAGNTGSGRGTGGGGTGAGSTCCNQYKVMDGGRGTSYSGGVGSGGASGQRITTPVSNICGPGGSGNGGGNGAGNPTGGTGGLLIVYSDGYENNGTLKATGSSPASAANGGGASGGGSINIFTNQATGADNLDIVVNTLYNSIKGTTNVAGGAAVGTAYKGGAGGAGSVNIGEIREGQYYDLKEIIQQDVDRLAAGTSVSGESLLDIVADSSITSGYYTATVNNESYRAHVYTLDGNQTFTSNRTFGDRYDAADDSTNAKEMVIVKVNGDLTINSGVTVGPYYSDYGGPKGFMLYVTGNLTNNGTIDNSHGAKAPGQNVYLYKNADDSYEYVPAEGGMGAGKRTGSTTNGTVVFAGYSGSASDIARGTGGGASGGVYVNFNQPETGVSGAGSRGTSYSGGSGGGMVASVWGSNISAFDAAGDGGAGGAARASWNSNYKAIGGTGNPGGVGSVGTSGSGSSTSASYKGPNGTGGLLIVYAYSIVNNGKIQANGTKANSAVNANVSTAVFGGPSGGGSVNIFYNANYISTGTIQAIGGTTVANGVTGGAGSVNIGSISTGTYQDINDILAGTDVSGESLLDIFSDSSITNGYYNATVNDESYKAHVWTFKGNQTFTSNMTFGDKDSVGDNSTDAKEMIIVKVDGDLTINEGVTVGPYSNEYGGPKGFMLYVTGTLTNNGTIDNSHGAKAEGQNVYLWRNSDGSYEYVPATGGDGGASATATIVNNQLVKSGNNGNSSLIARGTGGGASGDVYLNGSSGNNSGGTSGAGGRGTSYSGGAGGGMANGTWSTVTAPSNASNLGGVGGSAKSSYSDSYNAAGGTGNPGGIGATGTATSTSYKGNNGTGGLLIVHANNLFNNGTIQANGTNGRSVTNYSGRVGYGGPSGGGSINIFYNSGFSSNGTIQANGGTTVTNGATGGAGSISIGSIATGSYQEH